jgi:hypothetical protein
MDDDVVEQSGHRFPALNWRPPKGWRPRRGAVLLAAGLAAGLVLGLAGGYAAGHQHGGPPARGTNASSAALTDPDVPVLAQSGAECSVQSGHDLQLGIEVANQSAAALTLRDVQVVLPLPGLRAVAMRWTTCGAIPQNDMALSDTLMPPGTTAWFTVTLQVLTHCPGPLPVEFTVAFAQNGHLEYADLPGFSDLTHVPYSGCPPPPGSLRVERQALEDLVDRVAGTVHRDAREPQAVRGDGPDDSAVVLVVAGGEHVLGVHRQRELPAQRLAVRVRELLRARRVHDHRLPEQRQVLVPVAVLVRLADDLGRPRGDAAREKGGDVQLLPRGQVFADRDGDLRVESHSGRIP